MIRKGQACWSAAGAKVRLVHRFILDQYITTQAGENCRRAASWLTPYIAYFFNRLPNPNGV